MKGEEYAIYQKAVKRLSWIGTDQLPFPPKKR